MFYKIIEFVETKSVAVVPTLWINKNQVKWNEKLSPAYSRKGLFPENKWKNFHIKILTSKEYGTYDVAAKAMEKVLLINKTDIETDDISSSVENIIKAGSASSSEDESDNPLNSIKPSMNQNSTKPQPQQDIVIFSDITIPNDIFGGENINYDPAPEMVVPVPQNILTMILNKLTEMEQSIKKIEDSMQKSIRNQCNCRTNMLVDKISTRCNEILPLKDIKDLIEFNGKLSEDNTLTEDFERYLTARISAKDLRSFTRLIIEKTFTLELQGKINYTGVKMKTQLKGLISTAAIINILCKHVPELVVLQDENEKVIKAEAELKYQLQHYYDRKRSHDRKSVAHTILTEQN